MNGYLRKRNKEFFIGTEVNEELYQDEFETAVSNVCNFLERTVLKKKEMLREKKLFGIIAEKCYGSNNFSFSEANQCEKYLLEEDSVLKAIKNYPGEVKVQLMKKYEEAVENKNGVALEKAHSQFIKTQLHEDYRMEYFRQADELF